MSLPSPFVCELLDWLSRRRRVERSTVPLQWRASVRRLLAETEVEPELALVRRADVVLLEITPLGRIVAAAYRHGRAALAPGQRELV